MESRSTTRAQRRSFTADEVLRMVDAGILRENEPVELLDGELVVVSPQGPRHGYVTTMLRERLVAAYGDAAWVREEKPLAVSSRDMPEPDIAVIAGRPHDYRTRHPRGVEARLVVEVAVTSHDLDRFKLRSYAVGGVEQVWLVDVPARRLEVYREPRPEAGRFAVARVVEPKEDVSPPGTSVAWSVGELLG